MPLLDDILAKIPPDQREAARSYIDSIIRTRAMEVRHAESPVLAPISDLLAGAGHEAGNAFWNLATLPLAATNYAGLTDSNLPRKPLFGPEGYFRNDPESGWGPSAWYKLGGFGGFISTLAFNPEGALARKAGVLAASSKARAALGLTDEAARTAAYAEASSRLLPRIAGGAAEMAAVMTSRSSGDLGERISTGVESLPAGAVLGAAGRMRLPGESASKYVLKMGTRGFLAGLATPGLSPISFTSRPSIDSALFNSTFMAGSAILRHPLPPPGRERAVPIEASERAKADVSTQPPDPTPPSTLPLGFVRPIRDPKSPTGVTWENAQTGLPIYEGARSLLDATPREPDVTRPITDTEGRTIVEGLYKVPAVTEADLIGQPSLFPKTDVARRPRQEILDYLAKRNEVVDLGGLPPGWVDTPFGPAREPSGPPVATPESTVSADEALRDMFGRGDTSIPAIGWHGGPNDILSSPERHYDDRYIGTGEGSTYRGWGHYFGQARGTGEYYRQRTTDPYGFGSESQFFSALGKYDTLDADAAGPMSTTKRLWLFDPKDDRILSIDEVSKLPVSERAAIVDRSMRAMKADLDNLKVALDNSIKRGGNPDFDHGLLRSIKDHEIALLHYDTLKRTGNYNIEGTPNKGFLYKVDLPDHKFFLDWDKPLREQSPEVQAGLKAISKIQEDATFDPTLLPSADDLYGPRGPTGGTLYRILASRLGHSPEPESGLYGRQGGKEAASKLLYSVGIKGNTFLDQYSRGSMTKEEKTYNYVVFNPKDIKILDVERAAPSITPPGSPPPSTALAFKAAFPLLKSSVLIDLQGIHSNLFPKRPLKILFDMYAYPGRRASHDLLDNSLTIYPSYFKLPPDTGPLILAHELNHSRVRYADWSKFTPETFTAYLTEMGFPTYIEKLPGLVKGPSGFLVSPPPPPPANYIEMMQEHVNWHLGKHGYLVDDVVRVDSDKGINYARSLTKPGNPAIDTATTPPSTPNMAFTYGQMGEWLLVHSMKYAEPGNPMGERWIPLRSFWPETTLKHPPKFRSGRYRYVTRSIDFEWLADQLPDNPLGKPYYPRYSPTDVPTSYTNPLRGFGHPTYLWANPLEWLAEMTSLTARLGHKEIHRLDPKALKLLSHAFGNVENAYIQGITNEEFLPPNDPNRALFPTPLGPRSKVTFGLTNSGPSLTPSPSATRSIVESMSREPDVDPAFTEALWSPHTTKRGEEVITYDHIPTRLSRALFRSTPIDAAKSYGADATSLINTTADAIVEALHVRAATERLTPKQWKNLLLEATFQRRDPVLGPIIRAADAEAALLKAQGRPVDIDALPTSESLDALVGGFGGESDLISRLDKSAPPDEPEPSLVPSSFPSPITPPPPPSPPRPPSPVILKPTSVSTLNTGPTGEALREDTAKRLMLDENWDSRPDFTAKQKHIIQLAYGHLVEAAGTATAPVPLAPKPRLNRYNVPSRAAIAKAVGVDPRTVTRTLAILDAYAKGERSVDPRSIAGKGSVDTPALHGALFLTEGGLPPAPVPPRPLLTSTESERIGRDIRARLRPVEGGPRDPRITYPRARRIYERLRDEESGEILESAYKATETYAHDEATWFPAKLVYEDPVTGDQLLIQRGLFAEAEKVIDRRVEAESAHIIPIDETLSDLRSEAPPPTPEQTAILTAQSNLINATLKGHVAAKAKVGKPRTPTGAIQPLFKIQGAISAAKGGVSRSLQGYVDHQVAVLRIGNEGAFSGKEGRRLFGALTSSERLTHVITRFNAPATGSDPDKYFQRWTRHYAELFRSVGESYPTLDKIGSARDKADRLSILHSAAREAHLTVDLLLSPRGEVTGWSLTEQDTGRTYTASNIATASLLIDANARRIANAPDFTPPGGERIRITLPPDPPGGGGPPMASGEPPRDPQSGEVAPEISRAILRKLEGGTAAAFRGVRETAATIAKETGDFRVFQAADEVVTGQDKSRSAGVRHLFKLYRIARKNRIRFWRRSERELLDAAFTAVDQVGENVMRETGSLALGQAAVANAIPVVSRDLGLKPNQVQFLHDVRPWLDKLWREAGAGFAAYIPGYYPRVTNPSPMIGLRIDGLPVGEPSFFALWSRNAKEGPPDRPRDLFSVLTTYVRLAMRHKYLWRPAKAFELSPLDKLTHVIERYKEANGGGLPHEMEPLLLTLNSARGIPDDSPQRWTASTRYMARRVVPDSLRAAARALDAIHAPARAVISDSLQRWANHFDEHIDKHVRNNIATYLLALHSGRTFGLNPMAAIRDITNTGFAVLPRVGTRFYFGAMRQIFASTDAFKRAYSRALAMGAVPPALAIEYRAERDIVLRTMDKLMAPYRYIDVLNRVLAFTAQYNRTMWAYERFKIHGSRDRFVNESHLSMLHPTHRLAVLNDLDRGNGIVAARNHARLLALTTLFDFSIGNSPKWFRGVFGKLFGQYARWNINQIEQLINIGRYGTPGQITGALTLYATAATATYALGQALGINTKDWIPFIHSTFSGPGPLMSQASEYSQALTGQPYAQQKLYSDIKHDPTAFVLGIGTRNLVPGWTVWKALAAETNLSRRERRLLGVHPRKARSDYDLLLRTLGFRPITEKPFPGSTIQQAIAPAADIVGQPIREALGTE